MRTRPVGMVTVAALLLMTATVGCDRNTETTAWNSARDADTIPAYEEYLSANPDREHAANAREQIAKLREEENWRIATNENSIVAMHSFLQDYPSSLNAGEARLRMFNLAIGESYNGLGPSATSLEQVQRVASTGICPSDMTEDQRQSLLLVLAHAVRRIPAEELASFPEIKPDPAGDPIVVLAPERSDSDSGNDDVSFSIGGSDTLVDVRNVGGLISPASGSIVDSFMATKGDSVVGDPEGSTRNVRSYLTVRTHMLQGHSVYVLYTELPREAVPYGLGSGGSFVGQPSAVVPNGEGSILRFRGSVRDFYPGWTIESSGEEPLSFVLLKESGLTYLLGRGVVVDPDGRRHEFTALAAPRCGSPGPNSDSGKPGGIQGSS